MSDGNQPMKRSESPPELTTVAQELIQLQEVGALWIAQGGLAFSEEIRLGVDVSQTNPVRYLSSKK